MIENLNEQEVKSWLRECEYELWLIKKAINFE